MENVVRQVSSDSSKISSLKNENPFVGLLLGFVNKEMDEFMMKYGVLSESQCQGMISDSLPVPIYYLLKMMSDCREMMSW